MSDVLQKWQETMATAARDALDRMAMIDFELDDSAHVDPDADKQCVISMDVHGAAPASVELVMTNELAALWSSACAGVDPDELSPSDIEDGACELLNMIAGAAKTALGEQGIEFDLGIPKAGHERTLGTDGERARCAGRADGQNLEMLVKLT